MRLTVPAANLLTALKRVGAPTKRSPLTVLEFVHVAPDGPRAVRLTSSDMETEISVCMECDYDGDDPFLLPASKAAAWLSLQPKLEAVSISSDAEGIVIMRRDRSSVRVSALDAADFPLFSEQPPVCTVTLPGDALSSLLDSVAFAAPTRDVRYYLNGVLLEISGDRLTVVATDGHRLATANYALSEPAAGDPIQAVIPIAAVHRLRGLGDGEVTLSLLSPETTAAPALLSVTQSTGFELATKLVDGKYPDYRRAIPTEEVGAATVEHDALTSVVRQALVCANEKYRGLRLNLHEEEQTAAVGRYFVTGSTDGNEAATEFEFDRSGDPPPSIGFNGEYLLDALAAAGGESVTLSFSGHEGLSAMTMTASGRDGWLCVISPMRM